MLAVFFLALMAFSFYIISSGVTSMHRLNGSYVIVGLFVLIGVIVWAWSRDMIIPGKIKKRNTFALIAPDSVEINGERITLAEILEVRCRGAAIDIYTASGDRITRLCSRIRDSEAVCACLMDAFRAR